MRPTPLKLSFSPLAALGALVALATLAAPAAAQNPEPSRAKAKAVGVLEQPDGRRGCVVDRSTRAANCAKARACSRWGEEVRKR